MGLVQAPYQLRRPRVLAAPAPGRGEKLDEARIAPGGERLDSPLGPLAAASQVAALHPQLDPVAVCALHAGFDTRRAAGQPSDLARRRIVDPALEGGASGQAPQVRLVEQRGDGGHERRFCPTARPMSAPRFAYSRGDPLHMIGSP
jgi:hypothetical protein